MNGAPVQSQTIRSRSWAIWALLAIHLVAIAVSARMSFGGYVHHLFKMYIPLLLCQAGLLGFWLGAGEQKIVVRLPLVAASVAWCILLPYLIQGRLSNYLLMLVVLPGAIVVILVGVIRLGGMRLSSHSQWPATTRRRMQFSLGQLLLLVTVIAMFVAIVKRAFSLSSQSDLLEAMSVLCLMTAFLTLGAGWGVLTFANTTTRLGAVLGAFTLSVGLTSFIMYENYPSGLWGLIVAIATVALKLMAFLLASFSVLRWCGYRWTSVGGNANLTGEKLTAPSD